MTKLNTTTVAAATMTMQEVRDELTPASRALVIELRAGRDIDELATELLAQECLDGARHADVVRGLRELVALASA